MPESCELKDSNHRDDDPAVSEFIAGLKLNEFCDAASRCRGGLQCHPEKHIVGGMNLIQEIAFEDGITWLARIPLPTYCFQPEECIQSYVAVLKCVKKHTKIPVPDVYHWALESDSENTTGTSYLLMERLLGHELPTLEPNSDDDDDDEENKVDGRGTEHLRLAKKIHEQLTDFIVDLASVTFDKIGSLREGPQGCFSVTEFLQPNSIASSEEHTKAFKSLEPKYRGPHSTVSDYYRSRCVLGKAFARIDPDEESPEEAIEDFETLDDMIPEFQIKEYENGPFVISHDDLTVQNILVDEDFNITGIIDFPGTTTPIQSLCGYPWLFYDNYAGPVVNRDLFYKVFTSREASNPHSVLAPIEVRKQLLDSALDRHTFEMSLDIIFTQLTLPHVYESIYGRPYQRKKTKV